MKIQRILLPTAVMAGAAFLLLPTQSNAFTTIGGFLNLNQRDFRVFNNFTDPTANDNQTPDPNFPGYFGAPMAIWKANLEWSSRIHGDGNGDPTQAGGLGSGGANFDPSWQGLATTVGSPNDNIVSEISGSSGGTLAFTETPIADGWRIRFFQDAAAWQDGPSTFGPGPGFQNFCIQGVGCHEFGHALGLGHTTSQGATMEAAVASPATGSRSINADDIAGVQFIYGVASSTKPIITDVSVGSCGSITITGSNFVNGSTNEVWFTKTGTGGNGDPIKVPNQSSNGTTITVFVPPTAGPGDVLVHIPGTANNTLSNAWPVNPSTGAQPYNYCFTSPNSFDPNGAVIGWAGDLSVGLNNFTLITGGVPPGTAGIYYYGVNKAFQTFGNGFRCIGAPTFRLPIINANGFGDAVFQLDFNNVPSPINGGDTKKFQLWYRNIAGGGALFNLSDGLSVTFCP